MEQPQNLPKNTTRSSLMQAMSSAFVSGYNELLYTMSGSATAKKQLAKGEETSPYFIGFSLDNRENGIIKKRKNSE